jgi:hypothetical protein
METGSAPTNPIERPDQTALDQKKHASLTSASKHSYGRRAPAIAWEAVNLGWAPRIGLHFKVNLEQTPPFGPFFKANLEQTPPFRLFFKVNLEQTPLFGPFFKVNLGLKPRRRHKISQLAAV